MKLLVHAIVAFLFLTSCMNSTEKNNSNDNSNLSDAGSKISPEEALKRFDQAHLTKNQKQKKNGGNRLWILPYYYAR